MPLPFIASCFNARWLAKYDGRQCLVAATTHRCQRVRYAINLTKGMSEAKKKNQHHHWLAIHKQQYVNIYIRLKKLVWGRGTTRLVSTWTTIFASKSISIQIWYIDKETLLLLVEDQFHMSALLLSLFRVSQFMNSPSFNFHRSRRSRFLSYLSNFFHVPFIA